MAKHMRQTMQQNAKRDEQHAHGRSEARARRGGNCAASPQKSAQKSDSGMKMAVTELPSNWRLCSASRALAAPATSL